MKIFRKLNQLTDFKYERYLPTAFDNSLSLLEKIDKVIEFLNIVIETTNKIGEYVEEKTNEQDEKIKVLRDEFEELKHYILNGGLEENVVTVLNEWFDNGKLAEIINNEVFDMKANQDDLEELDSRITSQLNEIAINIGSFGLKSEDVDPNFDNTSVFNTAFTESGHAVKFILPPNKVFKVIGLILPSNVILDLNGSTLKLMDGQTLYKNVVVIGGENEAKNVSIINGVIDGNGANQQHNLFQHGIYILKCDNVLIRDVEIKNVLGDGLRLGYTGYLSKNVTFENIYAHDIERNDIALTHCTGVRGKNIKIDSIAYDSASIDIEIQSNTDIIKDVVLENLEINSEIQPMKIMKNGYSGTLENITLNNAIFSGKKGIQTEDADNVNLNNVSMSGGSLLEIVGTRNININGLVIKHADGNGLYIRRSTLNNHQSESVYLSNIDIQNSERYGLILQHTKDVFVNNITVKNNGKSGVGVLSNNQNVNINGVLSVENSEYGMEFSGPAVNVSMSNVATIQNALGDVKDLPNSVYGFIARDKFRFSNGSSTTLLEFDSSNTLKTSAPIKSSQFKFSHKYANGYNTIENGSLYEDTYDGRLKYKTQDGRVQNVSDKISGTVPSQSDGLYQRGEVIWKNNPTPGGYVGWICVASGTGSQAQWKEFGKIVD